MDTQEEHGEKTGAVPSQAKKPLGAKAKLRTDPPLAHLEGE